MPATHSIATMERVAEPLAGKATGDFHEPDMQVVTKGWWTLRYERKSVEQLEAEDRAKQTKA